MTKKEVYKEILSVFEKHEGILEKYYYGSVVNGIKTRIAIAEVGELFGIDDLPEDVCSSHWIKLDYGAERAIQFCEKDNNIISWSDDDRQPSDEYLYVIRFSTGAYIFGDFYPVNLFNEFFEELKSYNPKYSDTRNHCLYFSPDNARTIHEKFKEIKQKYADRASDEYKKHKAEKLRKELERLENEQQR